VETGAHLYIEIYGRTLRNITT